MMRQIKITKYQGNTHYTVHVYDSYGQEHHLGYLNLTVKMKDIERLSEEIWSNEVKNEVSMLDKCIKQCIDIDISNGKVPSLD